MADTHGWLAGHMKETPPEPNYRYVDNTSVIREMSLDDPMSAEILECLQVS